MGGDSNPRCLSAHTLSRRAQSTALSPIQAPHTLTANLLYGKLTASYTRYQVCHSERSQESLIIRSATANQQPEMFRSAQHDR